MNQEVFQDVFDKVGDYLPIGWQKMVFFAGYTKGSYNMKFYYKNSKGEYFDCFNIPGIEKANLIKLFMDIDKVFSKERKKLNDKDRWSIFTMAVDFKGNMKTEFDYKDHSEDMIAYEREWKKKYL